jgi:putative transposase
MSPLCGFWHLGCVSRASWRPWWPKLRNPPSAINWDFAGACCTTAHMPRRARVIVPGAAHHVTQRGNGRQAVLFPSDDQRLYLEIPGREAARHGAWIPGYCLMTNHVHLVAVPERDDSLARALGSAHSEYALALNRAHGPGGHVWRNRLLSCLLDGTHLPRAPRYVELNPVRAGMAAEPWGWPWSSARAHSRAIVGSGARLPLGGVCGRPESWEWREILAAGMEDGECDTVRRATCTGEPLGARVIVTAMERQAGRRLRALPRGRPRVFPSRLAG